MKECECGKVAEGMDVTTIARLTGLSTDEIEKLNRKF